jgi:hypothetical protein
MSVKVSAGLPGSELSHTGILTGSSVLGDKELAIPSRARPWNQHMQAAAILRTEGCDASHLLK